MYLSYKSYCRIVFCQICAFMNCFPSFVSDLWLKIFPKGFHFIEQLIFSSLQTFFITGQYDFVCCKQLLFHIFSREVFLLFIFYRQIGNGCVLCLLRFLYLHYRSVDAGMPLRKLQIPPYRRFLYIAASLIADAL